ncbi:MAG: hypothetical protein WBF19_00665 [Candidatus Cybelea sp.]
MFDRPAPEPAYWKAMVAALIVLVPLTLLLRLFVRMPAPAWVLAFVFATLAVSWSIHMRVRNDWRAADTMHSQYDYRRTTVAKNVRMRK